jgi:hypothetical protein
VQTALAAATEVVTSETAEVHIACSHLAARTVSFAWHGVRHHWKSGPDGADLALLQIIEDPEQIRRRFTDVVIASGDGLFELAALALRKAGVDVLLVYGAGEMNRSLRRTVRRAIRIRSCPARTNTSKTDDWLKAAA